MSYCDTTCTYTFFLVRHDPNSRSVKEGYEPIATAATYVSHRPAV